MGLDLENFMHNGNETAANGAPARDRYEFTPPEIEFFERHQKMLVQAQQLVQKTEGALQGGLQLIAEQQGFKTPCHLTPDGRALEVGPAPGAAPREGN